jgi:hypothetical protein
VIRATNVLIEIISLVPVGDMVKKMLCICI